MFCSKSSIGSPVSRKQSVRKRKGHGLLYEADQRLEDSMAEEQEATVHQRDGVGAVDSPLGEGRHCSDVS